MTLLVSGAGGKTGQALVAALEGRIDRLRLLVPELGYQDRFPPSESIDLIPGDMLDAEDWQRALEGVTTVYHIPPNMHPREERMGRLALAAAREQGVKRFVFHSVLHPQLEAMPHHWRKLRVEEALLESGLAFTILQPASYLQNLRGAWEQVQEGQPYRIPYPPGTRINWVDLGDVAAAAARILLEESHEHAIYELAGPAAPTQAEVAAVMGELLGRDVVAKEISREEWAASARQAGMDDGRVADFLAMFRHYERHGFRGNDATLARLLERAPRGLRAFLTAELGDEPAS